MEKFLYCCLSFSRFSSLTIFQILSVFKGQNGNKTLKELDLSKNNCKIPINEEFLDPNFNLSKEIPRNIIID